MKISAVLKIFFVDLKIFWKDIFLIIISFVISYLIGVYFVDKYFIFERAVLSTISTAIIPSLSTLIGLIAIFYVYRITPIKNRRIELYNHSIILRKKIAEQLGYPATEKVLNSEEIKEKAKKKFPYDFEYIERKDKEKEELIKEIRSYFLKVLFWAGIVISFCLLILPFGNLISSNISVELPLLSFTITTEIIFTLIAIIMIISFTWKSK